jgi:hypothetical protein
VANPYFYSILAWKQLFSIRNFKVPIFPHIPNYIRQRTSVPHPTGSRTDFIYTDFALYTVSLNLCTAPLAGDCLGPPDKKGLFAHFFMPCPSKLSPIQTTRRRAKKFENVATRKFPNFFHIRHLSFLRCGLIFTWRRQRVDQSPLHSALLRFIQRFIQPIDVNTKHKKVRAPNFGRRSEAPNMFMTNSQN